MFKKNLYMLIDTNCESIKNAFFSYKKVDNICVVQCRTKEEFEAKIGKEITLIVTDNESYLNSMLNSSPEWGAGVYIAKSKTAPSDIATCENLLDVISEEEIKEVLNFKVKRYLDTICYRWNNYLYKVLLDTTINSTNDMYWVKEGYGVRVPHVIVNNAFCGIVDKSKEDIIGKDHCYIWNVSYEELMKDGAGCEESDKSVVEADGKMLTFEEDVQTKGRMKKFNTYKSAFHDMFGNVIGTLGFGHDVTDINNMGLELSIMVENLPIAFVVCDSDFNVLRTNYKMHELLDMDGTDIVKFDWKSWIGSFEKYGSDYSENIYFKQYSDKKLFISVNETPIMDYFGNKSGYYCTIENITKQMEYEFELNVIVNVDELTGLYNRRYFYKYLEICLDNSDDVTLLYADLDNFKAINDKFGHSEGDNVLQAFAKELKNIFVDNRIFRIGGDEFTIVFDKSFSAAELTELKDKLDRIANSLFDKDGVKLGVSVGAAEYENGMTIDELMHNADAQMYQIKKDRHMKNGAYR